MTATTTTTTINTDLIGPIEIFDSITANIGGMDVAVGPITPRTVNDPNVRFGFELVFPGYDGAPEKVSFGAYREITAEVCRDWLIERFRSRGYKVFPCTTPTGLEFIFKRLWVKHHPLFSGSVH
jgi:hypothetical protein